VDLDLGADQVNAGDTRRSREEPGYGKVVPLHIVLARLTLQAPCRDISKGACLDQGSY
jgi:hypothetical protein